MISAKSIVAAVILLSLVAELTNSQTCTYMWDPIFESKSPNPPTMCAVSTTSGSPCQFPFNYGGITYKTCTIQGPSNSDFRPQCAISVNSNNTATAWSFCQVPTDAVIFYSTVRKGGYWTQNGGSTQGGTMLWIYGNRFAQNGFNSVPSILNTNTVQLVDGYSVYDCQMHNDKTTNTQLTCYAPALSEGVYQIRVSVNGYLIPLYQYYDPSRALFSSTPSQTPTITGITPQSGTPQSMITLSGSFDTSCYSRDVDGCSQDNNPLISRIYVGGHLCNLVNPLTGTVYETVTNTNLQCNFEGTEVGVFNISMLVTNEFGRALVSSNLYRVSAAENLYTFQSYAVISSITPNSGSTVGGTTLTITGNYFDTSATYPLVVNVAGQPCTILNVTTTTIQCQTPVAPTGSQNQYQGGRGLQLYRTSGFTAQSTLSGSPPSPTGTLSWTDDALYVSNTSSVETVWLVGFIRLPKTANYTFLLDTNGAAALYLSTDDNPANKVLIASATNSQLSSTVLNNNTNYYLFAVGSRSNGYLRLGVQARMHETTLTAITSSLVLNEIQRINVTANVVAEQQEFTYTTNSTNGTSEVQSILVDSSTFLIGFRGAYTAVQTGRPTLTALALALNDLPTISPLAVSVSGTSTIYTITFPVEMGNVPLLTCVSSSPNTPNVTEVVQGVASGSKIAFAFDGQLTDYIDFTTNVTQANLYTTINNVFGIQCPPSINNPIITTSIVYSQDFESNCVYDETPVRTNAFCGQCSFNGNTLLSSNTQTGNYLCFAYRILNNYVTTIDLGIQVNGDTTTTNWPSISFSPQADSLWHYTCIDIQATLIAQSSIASTVSSIVITNAWLTNDIKQGIYLDAVTIRTALPNGYEATSTYPVDQSANGSCVFPFYYNGNSYPACTLDNNDLPICADSNNVTYQCQMSSIEGVRRLYPAHQLVYNTLSVTSSSTNQQITTSFRYSDCVNPALVVPWPSSSATVTRLATASNAASGLYDLVINGNTYASIPVDMTAAQLANRLQASTDFGYLNVTRSGDCTGYSFTIEWIANGGQKSAISIANAAGVTPAGTTVTASIVQSGGVLFSPLSGDMTRIYHTNPQVEVLVGGYPSQCEGSNTCDFQWLSSQTPTVSSVVQNGMTLTITGTGFSTTPSSNTVIIGTSGTCTVTAASATSLTCTISAAPAGTYSIQVNIAEEGLATGTSSSSVNVSTQITSITPTQGGAGGGYILNVTGVGFSSSTSVTVDGNLCTNPTVIGFSLITCTVPPTAALSNTQVSVVVASGTSSATLPNSFTYNVANTPSITSSSPSVVTMSGGQITITGTNFGTNSVAVLIGTTNAIVRSISSTQILADLPSLAPGLYPVQVSTINGYARPAIQIEYRFYVQTVSPQIGSLYGGSDVYVQGQGFDNTTMVAFTDGTNNVPCNIVSFQSNQIHCQTEAAAPLVLINSSGVDPTYGSGFAWSPQVATVQQGAVVQWQWGSSALLTTLAYKVQQVATSYTTSTVSGGFDSGNASSSGSFSYQFQTIGTYYYYTPPVDQAGLISMRGVINVVAAQPQTLTAIVTSGSFTAQSCAFPFTFNSVTYTACTSNNDTQLWCSPTAAYTGQRLYCTPTVSVPASSCVSSSLINPSSCSQAVPSNVLQFLFTPCTIGTVSSISPVQGPAGTSITITGTGFSTTQCQDIVLIGSSYQCPVTSATATQIVCQIGSNSLLNAKSIQNFNVAQDLQGFLSNIGLIQFQFQAKITSVSPLQGSVAGGTLVTITGDGFTPADTRVIVGSIEYTSMATITYSQIQFITQIPSTSYIDQTIPITILVGTNSAVCSSGQCTYKWAQSVTPYLTSVSPSSINGPQTLTLTGQNFAATGSISPSNVNVTVDGGSCNVTSVTNSTIACNIGNTEAGNYSVVASINGVGTIVSSPILTSVPTVSSVSPSSGSIYGGAVLTINGNGFASSASNIQVTVGTSSCPIIQTTPGQVQCRVPSQGSNTSPATIHVVSKGVTFPSSSTFTYNSGSTPTVSSISPTSGTGGQSLVISGSNFVNGQTSVTIGGTTCAIASVSSSSSITCTVSSSPAGNQPVVVSVSSIGQSNSNIQFQYALQVSSVSPSQGSYGGGQSVTVTGDGFNTSSVSVTICGQACQSVSVTSNTQLTCVTPSATASSTNTPCSLTVTVGSLSQSVSYVYDASLTATVTSVSPARGGTGGGTTLTITGTNFPTSSNGVTVTVAGVSCSVQSVSITTITCLTGSYAQTTIQAPVVVNVVNGGYAIGTSQFQYIDLWSSQWTWGGESPPGEGTIVSIDSGKTVYFDTTTPILKALVIDNASLIFDDNQDVALNAEYIIVVNGGLLQVGTETNPFQHQAIITMHGQLRSIELPIFGAKVLALRDGTVDMHGVNVGQTWTRLGATANAGATQITLLQPVTWPVGSQIVIATTGDYESQGETETRIITAVSSNGLTLTLDSALNNTHLGITQNVGSTSVEIRAEVGLLSHNVVFQGSVTETWNQTIAACPDGFDPGEFATQTCFLGRYGQEIGSDQFGATIMASSSTGGSTGIQQAILRLSNIEVFYGGQAFRLGRYPVHFHMNGNMSLSYIKSSSIHQSFNRAVNIHASNYVSVVNNVIYNIMGGAMFLEDGVEIGNVLSGNLAVFVRTSSSLLNEDVTPAAFWVTNPNNTVANNAVAGGTHFGYWYRMLESPDGPSFATFPNFCPHRQPFGRFFNNSVHSTGRFGVWVFPEYAPTVGGSCWNDAPYQGVFDGLVSWRNNKGFEWVMSSTLQLRNAVVYDNADAGIRCVTAINDQATNLPNLRATFYDENTGSSVINSIIIGDSGTLGTPVVPDEGGLIVMWDRGLRVRNVSFINFPSTGTQAIYGPFIIGRCVVYCGGWLTKFSQLSFTNVANRGNFRWPYDGLYQDDDGTLGNVPGGIILSPDGLWNTSHLCTPTPHFQNAVTCPSSLGTWIRFAFNQANLGQNGEVLNVYDTSNHHTVVLNLHKRLTHPNGYMMNLLAKQPYLFQFENANTSVNLSYVGVAYSLAPGDYLIINHNVAYMPDQVSTTFGSTLVTQSTVPLTSASNNGDWYYDNSTNTFSYILKNPSTNTISADISLNLNVVKCRYPNCQPPIQPGLELPATARPSTALFWSNDSDWSFATEGYGGSNGVKPGDDTQIYIPRDVWLVADYPLPRILSLRIDGVLEFEQNMNNTLQAESLFINGGQLIVGWPDTPMTGSVDITITGSSSVNVLLPNDAGSMGPTVIGVFGGLDLHGKPHNVTWTRLASTAAAGQTSITLSEAVDWVAGDEILLTTTDTRIDHTDRRTIASVSGGGTVITLTSALTYTHIVIDNVFPNNEVYHVAGAVGLLTRNVRVLSQSPASELFGFRVLVTDYETNVLYAPTNEMISTYYKGYARLSNTQFIGFGQFVDAPDEDKREGIHLYNLGDWNSSRPTYVDSCSFDGGYYSAIGIWDTNGVPITNNTVYYTYESAIVTTGQNNIIQKNLVSTVYWSGQADPTYAEFDINYDGAIMSRDAVSVIMKDNLVSGAQRIAYRIQGDACPGTVLPTGISNDYDNNEAHSTMAGVVMWPTDSGFVYDTSCVLIKGFKTYKTWYYGLYINTPHNIIVDSCTSADSSVGFFTFVKAISPLLHQFGNNSITIRNSLIIGDITQDCTDLPDATTLSALYAQKAIPTVSATSSGGDPGGRSGVSYPFISGDNMVPRHAWTGISSYPAIDGGMKLTNVTFAFFNDVCSRHDVVIAVAQHNDDGQHPVTASQLGYYNCSIANLIFNGRPNLDVVDPSDCVDMDCDGLKKVLFTVTDGSLFGIPSSVFSQAEYLWGNQQHGVGDFRIPSVALASSTGQQININISYPYRGISRTPSCVYNSSYQMYVCSNTSDYRMLIIESMDSDTETRRLSPVAVMSDNGYIDLINGPQDHGWCNGYTCQKRISTFMALVESGHHYDIYLTSTTPNQIRFRVLNSDATIHVSLALYYSSLQQIDVYANDVYIAPTNRDTGFTFLMLLDQANGVALSSPAGTNFFNRTTQMAYFLIDGLTVIDLKISELIVLTFGLPPTTPAAFFTTNLVGNLAALLGVTTDQIRRVDIISASNNTRVRRQTLLSTIQLRVEIRNDPPISLSTGNSSSSTQIANINAYIINRYQSHDLQTAWAALTNGSSPTSLNVQEPGNQTNVSVVIISRLVLVTPPSGCRLQSACDVQPVLVAYDTSGNVIQKLGSNDQPWLVVATIVSPLGAGVIGAIANYTNGQTQFTTFGFTVTGSVQVNFSLILPYGVSGSFIASTNLISSPPSLSVSNAVLSAAQNGIVDVVSVNETFNIVAIIVDKHSKIKVGNIQWGSFSWTATASLYTGVQYKSNGSLIVSVTSSPVIIDTTAGTITATNLSISEPGMYIIKLQINSTDQVYSIALTSSAILVKQNTTVLETYTGMPPANITWKGDYYAIQASGQLEILRCSIYNYLVFVIGMPVTSDIILVSGSVAAIGVIGSTNSASGQAIGRAVAAIQANPNAIGSLQASFISIGGKTYYVSSNTGSGSDSSSSSSGQSSNTGLIVGLVVGLVGGALLIAGSVFGYKKYQMKQRGRRLINNERDFENSSPNQFGQNNEHITGPSKLANDDVKKARVQSVSSPDASNLDPNRLHSPLSNTTNGQRVPSAAISVTMLDSLTPHNQPIPSKPMPAVELIRFD